MYERHFGLSEKPFLMSADPNFLFLTPFHREALTGLIYAIVRRKGFAVLTGDAGTGKTTVLNATLLSIPASTVKVAYIQFPTLTASEFLELVLLKFGVLEVPPSKAQRLVRLENILARDNTEGRTAVLIVDEAHKLSPDVLEEVRLLTNFEASDGKLVQIVLAAQNELDFLLKQENMRQLKQRIGYRFSTRPLSLSEVRQYIVHRWNKAGGKQLPFADEAIQQIGFYSGGIPRLINILCDNTLVTAFAEGTAMIQKKDVIGAAKDLDLLDKGGSSVRRPGSPDAGSFDLRVPVPTNGIAIPTLARYSPQSPKQSWFVRSARKLGLVQ